MQKFVTAKRVTEQAIRELDQKVQLEAYLREKKEAILEDRKAEHLQTDPDKANALEDD